MKFHLRLILITLIMSITACQTLDPYTGESKTSQATRYGVGAAIICGLIGAGKSGQRARNAALGCGAIGTSVGLYMDAQEKELRSQLVNSGVQVRREGNNLRLLMPNKITFDFDRADLKVSFITTLDSIVMVLTKYPDTRLHIVGHTDNVGTESYNLRLSEQRALSVGNYLSNQHIARHRITTTGAGESQPIASNEDDAGRAMNRRVELSITPLEVN